MWLAQYGYESRREAEVFVKVRVSEVHRTGEINQLATWDLRLRSAAQVGSLLAEAASLGEVQS